MPVTKFLDVLGGRIAYDDTGEGPLIVCTPAMLDLRSELRFLVPLLVRAEFRVVTVDQRGMGETTGPWPEYGSTPLAHDLMALIRHLDAGPAIIYGTSNGAAAGVYVAAEAPELVRGLVLVAPFVRDGKMNTMQRLTMSLMRIPGLAVPLYLSYFPKWEPSKPADFAVHKARLAGNLKAAARAARAPGGAPTRRGRGGGGVDRPSRLQRPHAEAEARLGKVSVPVTVI